MELNHKKSSGSSGSQGYSDYNQGYAGSGYGYGYGYGEGGGGSAQRSLNDYLLILRERIWYVVVVFLVVFISVLIQTFGTTKIYESYASIQMLREAPKIMLNQQILDEGIRGNEDLNTLVKVMESSMIIKRVAERITGDDLKQFMQPYEKGGWSGPLTPLEVLGENRRIGVVRQSLVVQVSYRHPNPEIAAKVANMFVDEFIGWNTRIRIEESMRGVEDIQVRIEQQRKRVEEQAIALQDYREKNASGSLDQRKDIVTEKLKSLNSYVIQTGNNLKEAEIRWQQVQQRLESKGDLNELQFIANQGLIAQLSQQISTQKIAIAQMRERYRDRHPKMIEAVNSLQQAEQEIDRALVSASASIKAQYEGALRNDDEAKANLAKQSQLSEELDRLSIKYQEQEREFKINETFLAELVGRMRQISAGANTESQNARKLETAVAPARNRYVEPKISFNIGIGVVGGLGLGLAFAFFIAFIDDRVKSAFDIESVVGLPLLGIIPQIKKMEQPDKAQIVVNNADRQVAEAFLTLHSSLRLRDDSKDAKVFLITSTIPGEGKSFTATNLALTYAAHGDKVCIVDCDLRKPNIHKSFRRENLKGVIDVCSGASTLDEALLKEVHPNLDILPTGGRAKNPTHILSNKAFELMISELRKRYDRIILDTPPLAAVSDALVVLSLVDGAIFTIFFNKVRRKAAQASARRLLESNVTCFGAVLNGLNLAVSGYYYAQYYDKSYKDYYVVTAGDKDPVDGKGDKPPGTP
ncbi:sugar tyrosine-protein kinase [Verrucomicrobia bacterium IMCC26134]|nr:sugar tyrosine-protein kinase [Verrucomicrobia bacterium IMCC26134]